MAKNARNQVVKIDASGIFYRELNARLRQAVSNGRLITQSGLEELGNALVNERVGSVTAKIQMLAYQTSLDPGTDNGSIPIYLYSPEKDSARL